jgi:glutathione S-transferase
MQVYEFKGFPNPARVRMALAEKGLLEAASFVQVDVPGGAHREPAYLAINDQGVVPALVLEDGTVISECTAITEYLDHLAGDPVLTGRGARERALIHMVQRRVEAGFLDAVATYFHHATPGLGPLIETHQNAAWGERQRERAIATMHWMDERLAASDFLVAGRFTIADITAFAGFAFAGFAGIAIPDAYARLAAYAERLRARPSAAVAA